MSDMHISNNTWTLMRQEFPGSYSLKCGNNIVGRHPTADLQCLSVYVSRRHCIIEVAEQVRLMDCKSANGTYVNDEKLKPHVSCDLKEDDIIGIGVDSNVEIEKDKHYIYVLKLIKNEVPCQDFIVDEMKNFDKPASKRKRNQSNDKSENLDLSLSKKHKPSKNPQIKLEPQPSTSKQTDCDVIIISDEESELKRNDLPIRTKSRVKSPENNTRLSKTDRGNNKFKEKQNDSKDTFSNKKDKRKTLSRTRSTTRHEEPVDKLETTPMKRKYRLKTLVSNDNTKHQEVPISNKGRKSSIKKENEDPIDKPNCELRRKGVEMNRKSSEIINLSSSSDDDVKQEPAFMEMSYTQDDDDVIINDAELMPGSQMQPVGDRVVGENQIVPKIENDVIEDFISVDSDDEDDCWRTKLSMSIKHEVKKEVPEQKEDDLWLLSQSLLNSIREDLGEDVNAEDFVDLEQSHSPNRELTPEPEIIEEHELNRAEVSKKIIDEETPSEKNKKTTTINKNILQSNNKQVPAPSPLNKRRASAILIEAPPLLPPRRKSTTAKVTEPKTAPRARRRSRTKSLFNQSSSYKLNAEITKERKNRLKQIAEDEAKRKKEETPNKKINNNKPHVKITTKNRGAFLASDISKEAPEKTNCTKSLKLSEIDLFGSNIDEVKKFKIPKKKQLNTSLSNKQVESRSVSTSVLPNSPKHKSAEHNAKDIRVIVPSSRTTSVEKLPPPLPQHSMSTAGNILPLRSCLKSILKPIEAGKKKTNAKRVTIKIAPTIHLFNVENAKNLKKCNSKDAPIPVQDMSTVVKPPKISEKIDPAIPWEYMIAIITHWNPLWLQEQTVLSDPPPLLSSTDMKLTPMLHSFTKFDDYLRIVVPLLVYEFWSVVHNEWILNINKLTDERKRAFHVGIDDTFEDSQVLPDNIKLLTIRGHILLSKTESEKKIHPKDGDLVVLGIKVEHSKSGSDPNSFRRVLAYVTFQRREFLRKNARVHQELYDKAPHAYTKLNLEMKTYSKNYRINKAQAGMVSVICYMRKDLRAWQAVCELPKSPLCKLILNPQITDFPRHEVTHDTYFSINNTPLNSTQKKVVLETVADLLYPAPVITMIQGPPGTGKSHVIVSIVQQFLYGTGPTKKGKLLICAPSNAAVDEVLTRLLVVRQHIKGVKFKMLRLGVLDSMNSSAKGVSLQELAKRDVQTKLANPVGNQHQMESVEMQKRTYEAKINALQSSIQSATDNKRETILLEEKQTMYKERLVVLEKSMSNTVTNTAFMQMERESQKALLAGANIICTTLASCMNGQLLEYNINFDYCIVDEATQCTEPEALMPLMLGVKKLVLVGDPQQLPATVISPIAKKHGLDESLFTRLQHCFSDSKHNPVKVLNMQYRMHPEICRWPNFYFYKNILKNYTLTKNYSCPLAPYMVMKLDFEQQNRINLVNHEEAEFVVGLTLLITKLTAKQNYRIGIITPYQHQKLYIAEQLKHYSRDLENRVDVHTIDSCQGQERDVVVMSLVRTDGVGFLSHSSRLNVALTRAKHCLVVCGNFTSLQTDKMWAALLDDAERRKLLVTVSGGNTEIAYQTVIKRI